jgi:aldose 1-epimerase
MQIDQKKSSIKKEIFGTTHSSQNVYLFTLTHQNGIEAKILNLGGIVVSLKVPDRAGYLDDVVLGFDSLEDYLIGHPYFGAIVGRFANRIAHGKFSLDGQCIELKKNQGSNHLHGGVCGLSEVIWNSEMIYHENDLILELTYLSPNGEEGYPGNLLVTVHYRLTQSGELRIDYSATTDQPTIVNLTHHSYFNLAGQGEGDILSHQLEIDADAFIPVNSDFIPKGEIQGVHGTPFDFRTLRIIGERMGEDFEQLKMTRGYDHCFVLNGQIGTLRSVSRVLEPKSGRRMEVLTTEPGIQFYTGNFLNNRIGKKQKMYSKNSGFCLETQHFPDSPNHSNFPSTVLRPEQKWTSTTIYRFSR